MASYSLVLSFICFYMVCNILTLLMLFHAVPVVTAARSYHVLVRKSLMTLSPTPTTCRNSTKHNHKWVEPSGHCLITVDVSGSEDFQSVQSAANAVPMNNTVNVVILIKPGRYIEKVVVPVTKSYIAFQGARKNKTLIEWHDQASDLGPNGQQLIIYQTTYVTVFANYYSTRNISFKNTAPAPLPGIQGWQAVAFWISGDKVYFSGCGFYGAQDTLCDDVGRLYIKEC